MVRLTKIYTRLGDGGETHLGDMSRVAKTSPRIVAIGDVDELNAAIGVALTAGVTADHARWLARIQNDLFDLGADLAVPETGAADGDATPDTSGALRITPDQVARLEAHCDAANAELSSLTSFILPGGTPSAASLHLARTVCRRAERSVMALAATEPVTPSAAAYLNRLSDLLFILARFENGRGENDVLWIPGAERDAEA